MEIKILFEDKDIIAAFKPCGVPSQPDKTGDIDMISYLKSYTGNEINIINRIDRPVSGIMLFAKNSNVAAVLSHNMQSGGFKKEYTAVICGKPENDKGTFIDYIIKNQKTNTSFIGSKEENGAKEARLEYKVLDTVVNDEFKHVSLVGIHLLTGRHHQIRVQFSSRGIPIWGDSKYCADFKGRAHDGISLCSSSITFTHPKNKKEMSINVIPTGGAFSIFEQFLSK